MTNNAPEVDIRQHIAREFHGALTTRDWDRFRAVADPAITWTLPGHNKVSGEARGIEEVIARAELIASYGVRFSLEHILVSRDNVALGLHNTATRSDATLDEHLATVCRIDNGRIVEIETFLSDEPGMNAFFG